jgi:hypothetical protein
MSELIAFPVESDRRAVEVLSALRRLQAGCWGDPEVSGASGNAAASPRASRPGQKHAWRRRGFGLAIGALTTLVGGAAGAAVALVSAAAVSGTPAIGALLAAASGAGILIAAAGALVGAAVGATLCVLLWHRRFPATSRAPTVALLVSYFIHDGRALRVWRLRASILQVTLPADAEGRLKAILARAGATAAR